VPCSYYYMIVDSESNVYFKGGPYVGRDAVYKFLTSVWEKAAELKQILKTCAPMELTPEEEASFQRETMCHICRKEIVGKKVRDHSHYNNANLNGVVLKDELLPGKYRGAVCNECNIKYHNDTKFRVIFHNLKNYDLHHIINTSFFTGKKVEVIPLTGEKYLSMFCEDLIFIDSYQFLSSSLAKLAETLPASEFKVLKHCLPETHHLFMQKGHFPYEHIDSFEKFNETSLPPKEAFTSSLNDIPISDKDYAFAQRVWEEMKCETMKDYHDHYLVSDTLLLCDIFQHFRDLCIKFYELDPVLSYSLPGVSWDAAMRKTGITLDLINTPEMHMVLERNVRGGVAKIVKRHAEANQPGLPNYNPTKPQSHLLYLDCGMYIFFIYLFVYLTVNLYGYCMLQNLGHSEFKFLEDFSHIDFATVSDDSPIGYFLEVDLIYPQHLHEAHSDYPLSPTPLNITFEMLSKFQQTLRPQFKESRKLCPNFLPQYKILLHYKAFQLYSSLGMQVTRIHRVISFNQSRWLAPYIEFNNAQRKMATSEFEKSFYKLLNNSFYGRTLMNKRKHTCLDIVTTVKKALAQLAKPTLDSFTIINENLVLVKRKKRNLTLDAPIYLGFSILEYAKVHMLDFHYNTMLKLYTPVNLRICMSDTDSLLYEIKTEDLDGDLLRILDQLDTHEYPKNHVLYSEKNKKRVGTFKNEIVGEKIISFYGLNAKLYAILLESSVKKVGKGIIRTVLQNNVNFEHYKNVYETYKDFYVVQRGITSVKHVLHTSAQTKLALSCFDDKRYIVNNELSYPFGDYRIRVRSHWLNDY